MNRRRLVLGVVLCAVGIAEAATFVTVHDGTGTNVTVCLQATHLAASAVLDSISLNTPSESLNPRNIGSYEDQPVSFHLMIDTSITMRGTPLKGAATITDAIVSALATEDTAVVHGFDKQLHQIARRDPGQPLDAGALEDVRADGRVTEIYRLIIELIDTIDTTSNPATIVVMSDGKAEDTVYTVTEVVDRARSKGIVIHGIGFDYSAQAQGLRRLAEDTGGVFSEAAAGATVDPAVVTTIVNSVRNRACAEFDVVDFSDHWSLPATAAIRYQFAGEAPGLAAEPVQLPGIPFLTRSIYGFPTLWWAGGVGGFALIASWLLMVLRRSRRPREGPICSACGQPLLVTGGKCAGCGTPVAAEALAQLVVTNRDMTRAFVVDRAATRIGRMPDNDIVLESETVGRWHAIIQLKDDDFFVQDLGSANPTLVNGRASGQDSLQHGDLLTFGDVDVRFERIAEAMDES